ncbi:MAG: patatin-like phospholipase family protein [Treponema sp.]|nr:patatin-like phospholipase family protein [Treponema sp.]
MPRQKTTKTPCFLKISLFFSLIFFIFPSGAPAEEKGSKPTVALVLSGGGANGLAEIPLLEALEAEGIEPDFVLGVSMGAIIGSLYSSGYTPKQIRELMIELDIPGLINQSASVAKALPPEVMNPYYSNFSTVTFSKKGLGSQPGLIGDQKITNMLATCLSKTSHIQDFDKLNKSFRAVSTDVFTGEQIISSSGSLIMAVRGSMAVPLVFSPFPTQNKSLAYDGGLSNNLPIQLAKDLGADVVIAMDVLGKIGVDQEDFSNLNSTLVQSINLIVSANTRSQYPEADILIRPNLSAITAGAFGQVEQIIAVGEKALEEYKDQLHALALELEAAGYPLQKLDYDRKSYYDSLQDPLIESIIIEDISISDPVLLPKPSDLKNFAGHVLDKSAKEKLVTKLEQLRYTYNLSTLTYELREMEGSPNYTLAILANHYAEPADRLFIGGRPALESNFSKDDGAAFIMLPFITAGITLTDILPLSLTLSSDRFFYGTITYEPSLFNTSALNLKLNLSLGAKYGSLHPQKYLTYSTLLADDDFGFYADAGIKAFHAEWMRVGTGIIYDLSFFNSFFDRGHLHAGISSFYAEYAIDTLADEITGLDGLRLDAKAQLGTDFSGSLFYSADFFLRKNFNLVNAKNSLGFDVKAALNAYPAGLLDGYTDFGGFDGMCGYGYGSLKQCSALAGIAYRRIIFSAADMPILTIAQVKAGFFDNCSPYSHTVSELSAKNPFDVTWNFDAGTSLHLALSTPIGNLLLGGGYSFCSKRWSLSLGFM